MQVKIVMRVEYVGLLPTVQPKGGVLRFILSPQHDNVDTLLKWRVPIPGVEPGPPGWKPGILTARPYGTPLIIIRLNLIIFCLYFSLDINFFNVV